MMDRICSHLEDLDYVDDLKKDMQDHINIKKTEQSPYSKLGAAGQTSGVDVKFLFW